MNFGVVLLTQHDRDRNRRDCAAELREQAQLVDREGYDSVWVAAHHFTEDLYFENFQTLGHIAALTDDVTVGTCVAILPLHNPVQLAERLGTLDVLADGRLVFGAGVGYRDREFALSGVPKAERGRRTTEAIGLIRRLWREDGVSFEGEIFDIEDASINPKPLQDGGPPIWLGGGAEPALRRAGDIGDGWVIGSSATIDAIAEMQEVYEDALTGEPHARPLRREVFVAETDERAKELALPSLSAKYDKYAAWGSPEDLGDEEESFEEFAADRFLIGAPETVAAGIERYEKQLGVDHLVMRFQWPGMDHDVAARSMELFADEVIPAV
ncbi:MAG: LLM class flavin-dependent oxidoreductase [Salinirussus sp.]